MAKLYEIFPVVSAKILDYLINEYEQNPHKDFDRYMIARGANVTTRSLNRWLPVLKNEALITLTRKGGTNEKLEFYKLTESIAVNHFVKFWESL